MSFTLEDLKDALVHFSTIQSQGFTENCIVALESIPHKSGCELDISGLHNGKVELNWSTIVNKNGYKEQKKYTEKGAEALSFFLATEYTDYEVVEEALIGTGIDYWLGYGKSHANYDPMNFFNARLEISGILHETPTNTLLKRVSQKKKQSNASDSTKIPAYISVIEFSNLKAHISKK